MIKQTPGKIYLADQRGVVESSLFRRHSTFNFGTFASEHKEPFGILYGLNEETLAGGHQLEFSVSQASYIVLLPITGAIEFSTGCGTSGLTEVEQVTTLSVPAGNTLRLRNPFAGELVSFLHLWLRATAPLTPPAPATARTTVFYQQALENQLCELVSARTEDQPPLCPQLPVILSLGQFMGRHEVLYKMENTDKQLFVFVIAGAFEVEGRLLHEKDGLALWDTSEIELEALSNHALVLVVEMTA
ncbi:MAG: hypothetical protein ACRYG7_44585 [Janthinobacterium lividum]